MTAAPAMLSRMRLLLALLALIGQLALGGMVPAMAAASAASSPWAICSAHPTTHQPPTGTPVDRKGADCALCPACMLAVQVALPAMPPVVPPPQIAARAVEPTLPAPAMAECRAGDRFRARGPPPLG